LPQASTKWQVIETDPAHHAAKVGDKANLHAISSLCSTCMSQNGKRGILFQQSHDYPWQNKLGFLSKNILSFL